MLNFLRFRRVLIILDGCEHVIEESRGDSRQHSSEVPQTFILLATSRETLQVAGERVLRLAPLDCPPEQPGLTALEVFAYPATPVVRGAYQRSRRRLFTKRRRSSRWLPRFVASLIGIALAIRLAAGRAANFGVRNTVATLGSAPRFPEVPVAEQRIRGTRIARATLDWSHNHLSEAERLVLRRVAIFIGPFTLEAAILHWPTRGEFDRSEIEGTVGNLGQQIAHSSVAERSRGMYYSVLNTTRSYALEKLAASGEHNSIALRHASHLNQSLKTTEAIFSIWSPSSLWQTPYSTISEMSRCRT